MSSQKPPWPPPETEPTFETLIREGRARLEAAQRELKRLKDLPLYPYDHF